MQGLRINQILLTIPVFINTPQDICCNLTVYLKSQEGCLIGQMNDMCFESPAYSRPSQEGTGFGAQACLFLSSAGSNRELPNFHH